MVLSIGMIVKNEEEYLEQCLAALQPILDELDSELIIADTGSTDRTVEIAKKFTDNVFYFEWINDFSAARNSTLERATGEWFMFIDADEIAVDCTPLIKFFKSGEYRKFNSATYIQRSYPDDSDRKRFFDFRPSRAVRREAGTKFENPIHEVFDPFRAPIKHLDFVVDHYGYRYDGEGGEERSRKKSERNLELLLNELNSGEIGPGRINIYHQIADCYRTINDYDNALKYIDMGMEKSDHNNLGSYLYYSQKVSLLMTMDRLDEIIEITDECFDTDINPYHTKDLASDCYLRSVRGYVYFKRKEYRSAIQEFIKFFDLYRRYCSGKLNTDDLMLEAWRTSDSIVKAGYNHFFESCIKEKQFALAKDHIKAIHLEDHLDDTAFMVNHIPLRVDILENDGYNGLNELYSQLDESGRSLLLSALRRKMLTAPENRAVVIKKIAELDETAAEVADIYNGYWDNALDIELIRSFLEKHGSENAEDILYILLEKGMDIAPFLLTEDFFADRTAHNLIKFFPDIVDVLTAYNIDLISPDGLVRATSMYGYIVMRAENDNREITGLFEIYGALGVKWFSTFGNPNNLPGEIRAALFVSAVVSAKINGDYAKFMSSLRELKNYVSELTPSADAYMKENKNSFETVEVNPEFEKLAVQVKHNIRELISSGKIGEARKLIREFEGIAPNDPEIETLKDELNNSLQ